MDNFATFLGYSFLFFFSYFSSSLKFYKIYIHKGSTDLWLSVGQLHQCFWLSVWRCFCLFRVHGQPQFRTLSYSEVTLLLLSFAVIEPHAAGHNTLDLYSHPLSFFFFFNLFFFYFSCFTSTSIMLVYIWYVNLSTKCYFNRLGLVCYIFMSMSNPTPCTCH